MAIARTGVQLQFTADTGAAAAQMAALERRLESLQNRMGRKVKTAAFDTAGFDVRINSQIRSMDDLTKRIQKGNASFKDMMQTIRGTNGLLEYQNKLQRAYISNARQLPNGQILARMDLDNMRQANSGLQQMTTHMATAAAAGKAYGNTLMNLGKNMAFMGRQALLSITGPIAVLAGGSAAIFYQLDKQLTNIAKLSGDSSDTFVASTDAIRKASLELARDMNDNLGTAVKDSLELQGQFAALGKSGKDLQAATASTGRLMRLGDMDTDTAVKFSNTMQTVFGQTNEELQNTINLINEMENSTVLTMQDVSEAMPKIGPIVKSMGGDIRDTLTLLESLKRGGIDAVEGANAIKSITGSIFRPTKKLQAMYSDMVPGDDIEKLVKRNGMNIVNIVKDLGDITKDWQPDKKLKLFYQLAGKEQAARMIQLSDNLALGNEAVTRTLGKSAEELQGIADQEIRDIMNSASVKFDQQIQRAILFAQEIGAKVLPIITKAISTVLTAFDKVGNAVGKTMEFLGPIGTFLGFVAKVAVGIAATFGPAMLAVSAGLMVMGASYKAIAGGVNMAARSINKLGGGRFAVPQMLTAQQRADQLAMEQNQAAQRESALTTAQLEAAIKRLTLSYEQMTAAATGASVATARVGTSAAQAAAMANNPALMPTRNTYVGAHRAGGGLASDAARERIRQSDAQINRLNSQVNLVPLASRTNNDPALTRTAPGFQTHNVGEATERAAAAQERATASAQKWGMAIGGVTMAATLLTGVLGGTNQMAQTVAASLGVVAMGAMMFPAAAGGLAKKMFAPIQRAGSLAFQAVGMIGTNIFTRDLPNAAGAGAASMGARLGALASFLGPVALALAAIATAVWAINKAVTADSRAQVEHWEKINQSAQAHADILGFTLKEYGQVVNASGEVEDSVESIAKKYMENETASGGFIQDLTANLGNMKQLQLQLSQEAIKIKARGGTDDDVKKMVEAALIAAGADQATIETLKVDFNNVDFAIETMFGPEMQKQITDAFSGANNGMSASLGDQIKTGELNDIIGLGIWEPFGPEQKAGDLSDIAPGIVEDLAENFTTAFEVASDAQKPRVANLWGKMIDDSLQAAIDSGDSERIANARAVSQKFIEELAAKDPANFNKFIQSPDLKFLSEAGDIKTIMGLVAGEFKNAGQGAAFYTEAVARAAQLSGGALTDAQKGIILNMTRERMGWQALTGDVLAAAVAQGNLGPEIKKVGQNADATTTQVDELAEAGEKLEDKQIDWDVVVSVSGVPGSAEAMEMTLGGYKEAMQKVQNDIFEAASRNAQDNFDARMDEMKAQQDAAMKALDAEGKAIDERYKNEEKAMDKAQDLEKRQFDKGWESRMEAEMKVYDDRVKAIEDAQEAEDELERQRQRNTEREAARLRYLAGLMTNNIDMNIAIAGGDLDQAARLSINQGQAGIDYSTEVNNREAGYKKEDDDRGRKTAIETIKDEQEARKKMLEEQKELERIAMEDRFAIQREEFDKRRELERADLDAKRANMQAEFQAKQANEQAMFQENQRRMQMELDTLRATLPRTTEEMNNQKRQIEDIYAKYGVQLTITGDQWAQIVGTSLTNRVTEARNQMSNDRDWQTFGQRVTEGISRGSFNMSSGEFNDFLRTGNMPGLPSNAAPRTQGATGFGGTRHDGGPINGRNGYDKYNSRGGIPKNAPMRSDEVSLLAQKGEYVIRRDVHKKLGTGFLNDLNGGKFTRHDGGPIGGDVQARHDGGPAGVGGMGAAMTAAALGSIISKTAAAAGSEMTNALISGSYGGGGDVVDLGGANGGYGLRAGTSISYGGAGFPPWVYSLAKAKGVQASTYPGHQEGDRREPGYAPNPQHLNRGIDWSGSVESMQNFAEYLLGIAPRTPTLEQIIWQNPRTGQKIGWHGRQRDDGSYFAADYGGHQDHVHTRSNGPIQPGEGAMAGPGVGAPGVPNLPKQVQGWTTAGIRAYGSKMQALYGAVAGGDNGAELGAQQVGNKEFYIKEIIDEGKRRGLDKNATIIALMTAMQESTLRMLANYAVPESLNFPHDGLGSDHDSIGLFQQRSAGWGTVAQRMNARASAGMFYNKLAGFNYNGMSKNNAAQKVQVSGTPNAYAKWENDATMQANRYFDFGGLAIGKGFLPKNTIKPERVLSPEQTKGFENLTPFLGQFANKGIIGYDSIVKALKGDNSQILAAARNAIEGVAGVVKEAAKEYNFEFSIEGNVYGVEDLEAQFARFKAETIRQIEEAELKRRRRVEGR